MPILKEGGRLLFEATLALRDKIKKKSGIFHCD
jgi:hypothetical protein